MKTTAMAPLGGVNHNRTVEPAYSFDTRAWEQAHGGRKPAGKSETWGFAFPESRRLWWCTGTFLQAKCGAALEAKRRGLPAGTVIRLLVLNEVA